MHATHSDGAYIVDSYPLGVQLRTRSEDIGVTLGGSKRRYIFDPNVSNQLAAGWYFFHSDLPEEAMVAVHSQAVGLEVDIEGNGVNGSVGYQERLDVRAGKDEDVVLKLHYEPGHLKGTRAELCGRGKRCLER